MRPAQEIREIIVPNRQAKEQQIKPKRQTDKIAREEEPQGQSQIETLEDSTTNLTEIERYSSCP